MNNLRWAVFGLFAAIVCGCTKPQDVQIGGFYTWRGAADWVIVKVVAVDESTVYTRDYHDTFPSKPRDVDPAKLTDPPLTKLKKSLGNHPSPIDRKSFLCMRPVLLRVEPISQEEAAGYTHLLNSGYMPAHVVAQAQKRRLGLASNRVETVQADARRMFHASTNGDIDLLLSMTYSKVFENMGGSALARRGLQAFQDKVQSGDIRLERFMFSGPPRFTNTAAHDFAIVPVTFYITTEGRRFELSTFHLGICDLGRTNWTYLAAAELSAQEIALLFPDFPPGLEFPTTTRKELSAHAQQEGT